MNRSRKIAGAVVLALVAMSAFASMAFAAAPEFHVESAPATLKGTQVQKTGEETQPHFFKVTNQLGATISVECGAETSFAGTLSTTTGTSAMLTPTYKGCKLAGLAATVDPNSCTFTFNAVAGSSPPTSTVDLICTTAGEEFTITRGTCVIHVPPQTGLAHVVYTNTGTGTARDVDKKVTLTGIKYKITSGCPNQTVSEEHTNGEYKETVTVKATTSGGAAQGFWIE
jgi:hypothetical protein